VVNLGIKQPSDVIINAALAEKADAIGLSGAAGEVDAGDEVRGAGPAPSEARVSGDLRRRGADAQVRGGRSAPEYNGGIFYADDAFAGLHLMEDLSSPNGAREKRIAEGNVAEFVRPAHTLGGVEGATSPNVEIPAAPNIPQPPFFGRAHAEAATSICARSSSTSTRPRCSRTSGS
jgi:5-methyltetrahydrofolate--homocysteine methyltransferase